MYSPPWRSFMDPFIIVLHSFLCMVSNNNWCPALFWSWQAKLVYNFFGSIGIFPCKTSFFLGGRSSPSKMTLHAHFGPVLHRLYHIPCMISAQKWCLTFLSFCFRYSKHEPVPSVGIFGHEFFDPHTFLQS